ncbi:MAG: hypothetical protein RQ899_11315 [Pseudomonadales bacterium]|nr:hypothetical protein [Pseudomonadales bacterium]
MTTFSTPISRAGTPLGVAIVDVPLKALQLQASLAMNTRHAAIIGARGRYVLAPDIALETDADIQTQARQAGR